MFPEANDLEESEQRARRVNIEIGSPNCCSFIAASEKPKRTHLYNAVQSCTVIAHVHQHDRQ
jgi:hypothetical protein